MPDALEAVIVVPTIRLGFVARVLRPELTISPGVTLVQRNLNGLLGHARWDPTSDCFVLGHWVVVYGLSKEQISLGGAAIQFSLRVQPI